MAPGRAVLVGIAALLALPAAASADLQPNCTQATASDPVRCVYPAGGEYTFTAPANVTSVAIRLAGGMGGVPTGDTGQDGGTGDVMTGSLAVTTGQTVFVVVGGNGSAGTGGFNGGGAGCGGGGGATDLRTIRSGPTSRGRPAAAAPDVPAGSTPSRWAARPPARHCAAWSATATRAVSRAAVVTA